jgi:hypothetical protein
MSEVNLNDPVVLANLPGKDIYGVPVGNLVNAIENAAERIESLEARERELVKERDLAIAHDRQPYPTAEAYEAACAALSKTRDERDALQSKKSLLTKAWEHLRGRFDLKVTECRNAWESYRAAESRAAELQRAIEAKDAALIDTLPICHKKGCSKSAFWEYVVNRGMEPSEWYCDDHKDYSCRETYAKARAALSPRQPQAEAKPKTHSGDWGGCSCEENHD